MRGFPGLFPGIFLGFFGRSSKTAKIYICENFTINPVSATAVPIFLLEFVELRKRHHESRHAETGAVVEATCTSVIVTRK